MDNVLIGRVLDQAGASIKGARVLLRLQASGFEREVSTDASGGFRFNDLRSGIYILSVSGTSFSTLIKEIGIPNESGSLEVRLQPGTISERVTATRTEISVMDAPIPVSIVDRAELAHSLYCR